ncbi:MAG: 5,6-dimethylbenzimidazole synthase [Zetaproteobacteria bacterium]|nr:MAG: 5,6-dimethylbenzimidazole synthase [Zetaproteobacteria bacterium]
MDAETRNAFYRVLHARRDMRHFAGGKVAPEVLQRILEAGHAAPSVGFMQPWRFIRISDRKLREELAELVEKERQYTAERMGERSADFLRLKVEGILECAELIAVVMAPDDGTIFGRRTMPEEMTLASCACAIENMWLAARAENLGMGWVSFFDPQQMAALLCCPPGAKPLALLCLGPVSDFYKAPMLELSGWRKRRPLSFVLGENRYPDGNKQ